MSETLIQAAYLLAAALFVLGIKGMTRPRTAVLGNRLSALGMLIAVVATLLARDIIDYRWIIGGILLGSVIGLLLAVKIRITAMPQLVALLNGFGGGASVAVAAAEYLRLVATGTAVVPADQLVVILVAAALAVAIGAVTLLGSLVAFAKLQELIPGKPIGFAGMPLLNGVLLALLVVAGGYLVAVPEATIVFWLLLAIATVLGLTLVLPIGGADMPVVIALLNSYSGVAAAAAGFVMGNSALIITGALVGASGLILTQIMCKAMNRSLPNVLFGRMGAGGEQINADDIYQGKVKASSPEEVAMLLETARRVVIVPGFGLAMSQAQHAVRDLTDTLEARGVEVEFGIHPVAGRMPGHMNVLLAEAEIAYEKLIEMDAINATFEQTDVAIVIGANDVTNPMAREDKGSPIYGMPILNVDKARTVVVVKRSLSAGFAGLPNPLFAKDNTLMLFGDGKKAIVELVAALKSA
ncbi:MAG: NAD(P)(+) transhydrogenase (Re/Si-specific) subunit beta [Spongiibacteraceae bacterium]|jgi:NAD(P) transhydrogenase subunit beta|nr:NAD(P)(+) transhydrogenase (Re/Si-specific) subunit beta [Spongiibacteraceae bacterium]